VRDDMAGKKVKCPRCAHIIPVPRREEEVTEILSPPEDEGITPPRRGPAAHKPARRRPEDEEYEDERDEHDRREERVSRSPRGRRGRDRDEEDLDERDVPDVRRKGKYKPCPRCGATGATRVVWTPWGSFYGPAMFSHVKCPDCGYQYNGKTGRSNLIPAIIFVTVPLLGILAILGVIGYIVVTRPPR
jgi:DNA-directed RNA polymerase subunit RPC12/RpoP